MESAFKSLSSSEESPSLMACKPYYGTDHHPTKTPSFRQLPAPPQPPLLPLPVHRQASPQYPSWPASRSAQRAKKPCHATPSPKNPASALANGASADSAPIVVAAPSKKRMALSSVPMPTSLLITAGRKVPTACAVEVAKGGGGGCGCVYVGATDKLWRLLQL